MNSWYLSPSTEPLHGSYRAYSSTRGFSSSSAGSLLTGHRSAAAANMLATARTSHQKAEKEARASRFCARRASVHGICAYESSFTGGGGNFEHEYASEPSPSTRRKEGSRRRWEQELEESQEQARKELERMKLSKIRTSSYGYGPRALKSVNTTSHSKYEYERKYANSEEDSSSDEDEPIDGSGASAMGHGEKAAHHGKRRARVECKARVETSPEPGTRCDKCDETSHRTADCPWFKKARENHRDAQSGKPRNIGGAGGNFVLKNASVVRMPGDGSCLFHSLAHGLGGKISARQLRREIAAFIEGNPDLEIAETPLKDWVSWDSKTSIKAYARRMSISGWGGGIECAACSRLKGVNVHIYEQRRHLAGFKRISCFDLPGPQGKRAKTIHILYCGGVHYNALVPHT